MQRWASTMDLRHEILPDILRMLDLMGKDKPPSERAVILMFDEMKVEKVYKYDPKGDVVKARGPFRSSLFLELIKFDI